MTNLLKSKFLIGALVAVFVVLGAYAVQTATVDAANCTSFSRTLKYGSRGEDVRCLQQMLNEKGFAVDGTGAGSPGKETPYFGPATLATVKTFQAAEGLTVDGIFGPISRSALVARGSVSGNFPAGCNSAAGYSPTTGVKCDSLVGGSFPAGCTSAAGFSVTTGLACNGGTTTQTGPVSASLASDNPASSTLVAGQATADLAHFMFTGSGTVTSVVLKRIGVSADSTPSNVYLFDGATRLTDAASVNNTGTVTFNIPAGIFTVNGSKIISVRSDIAASTSGQTVGMMLSSFTTSSGTTNVTISGNIHTIASATIATVTHGTVTPSGATLNPGAQVTLWQDTLSISNRDVWMKRLALRNVGSAPASAFTNFKLYVNGVVVGTATGLDANGYVTFDLRSAPVLLVTGSRLVRVDADIISGASRTVQLSLRNAADADFVDSSFGVNVTPSSTPWTASSANTISGSSGGTLTIEKDISSPSTNVTLAGNGVTLGVFKITAYGEPIKIETLTGGFTFTDGGTANAAATLRNGRMMISTDGTNWVQYGSDATLLAAGTSYTLNYTVLPGTPIWVRLNADIYDNDGTGSLDTSDTLLAKIIAGSSNAQRVDSLGSFSAPASAVSANTLAIASAAITLTKNGTYPNQTTDLPATNFKIGAWNLSGSSVEDVLLTTLSFDVDEVVSTEFDEGDITNMYVVVKNSAGTIVAQPASLATVSATDNNFSINYTLAKNTNISFELYGSLADDGSDSAIDALDSFKTDLTVTGTSLVSGTAVTATSADTDGQTIAYGAATLTASVDASSPVKGITYDNQTVTTAAFKFASLTSAFNVTDLTITLTATGATVVNTISLYDGATLIATRSGGTTVNTFTGLNWNIPANQNKILTVKLGLGTIGYGYGTSEADLATELTVFTAVNQSTGVSDASAADAGPSIESGANPTSAVTSAFAAIPVITKVALASQQLTNQANVPLLKFKMDASGGPIAWGQLFFDTTHDTDTALATNATTGVTLWDVTDGGNTSIAGVFTNTTNIVGDVDPTGSILFVPTAEQVVSTTKTYELRGTITSANADGDFVTVTLANDSTSAVVALAALATIDDDTDAPIIWSDMSASGHSTATLDWTSDFGVKNLPISDSLNW